MKLIKYPGREELQELVKRPRASYSAIAARVSDLVERVRAGGDSALFEITRELDKASLSALKVSDEEFESAVQLVPTEFKEAVELARSNIATFHQSQQEEICRVETMPGVVCWRKSVPISPVGLYVPGGTAPLLSTAMMLGIPALIAGCKDIVVCTPPRADGSIAPELLYVLGSLGLRSVFKVGGAQAVAAMAFGTESILKVEKIFGPGNQYVTAAKQLVSQQGTAIDLPAGPSEVAILADGEADPRFVAADLLAQAEHGADSQVFLVTESEELVLRLEKELELQLAELPRRELALGALKESRVVVVSTLDEGMELINQYAPEHLIIMTEKPSDFIDQVECAGSVFLGAYSPESVGDYASGTNHTLPTDGYASRLSGVSLDSFVKKITFQELSIEGLKGIGRAVEILATAEGLEAHKRAVSIRLGR